MSEIIRFEEVRLIILQRLFRLVLLNYNMEIVPPNCVIYIDKNVPLDEDLVAFESHFLIRKTMQIDLQNVQSKRKVI